jgi:hypothetical protein
MLGVPQSEEARHKEKWFTEEQIVRILRDAEIKTIDAAPRQHGVSEPSIYH